MSLFETADLEFEAVLDATHEPDDLEAITQIVASQDGQRFDVTTRYEKGAFHYIGAIIRQRNEDPLTGETGVDVFDPLIIRLENSRGERFGWECASVDGMPCLAIEPPATVTRRFRRRKP